MFAHQQSWTCAHRDACHARCHNLPRPVGVKTHLQSRQLKQRKGAPRGNNRGRLHVAAGLNYPHMPNRMRRQIQEVKYTVQLYIARLAHALASLPGLRQILQACHRLREKLDPYILQLRDYRSHLREEYYKRVDAYDEFCLAELKRKYKWKAYARRDEELLTGFLKLAFYRFAVVLTIAEWEFLAPCGFLWTCILPLIIGRCMIDFGDPIWWWYCAVIVIFIFLKHPFGMPLRWI